MSFAMKVIKANQMAIKQASCRSKLKSRKKIAESKMNGIGKAFMHALKPLCLYALSFLSGMN